MGNCCPLLFSVFPSVLASTTSVQQTTFLSRHFLWRLLWMAVKSTWKKWGNFRKIGGEGPGWVPFCGLSKRNYSGVLEMPGASQNPKRAVNHQTSPGTAGIVTNNWKPNVSHRFPLWSTKVLGKEMKGLRKQQEGVRNVGKTFRESRVDLNFVGFPVDKFSRWVLEMPGAPQKRKWSAKHEASPETGKNCQKPMKPNISHSFPQWPMRVFLEGSERNIEGIWGHMQG